MKHGTSNIAAVFLIGLVTVSLGMPCFAKTKSTDAHAQKIENVLDRLEQRLIDKESSPLTLEEQEKVSQKISNEPQPKQKYVPKAPANITGKTPSGKNLQELQRRLNEYDNRIEILESDLRKLQAATNDAGATDNIVSLQIKTPEGSKIAIRTLSATLDGNILYSQVDPAGLWMPAKAIPIFYGPLQPGSHKVEIDGYIAPHPDQASAATGWRQKNIKQSFNFSVAEGRLRKVITIEIGDSKGDGTHPIAKLIESEEK